MKLWTITFSEPKLRVQIAKLKLYKGNRAHLGYRKYIHP